MKKEVLYLSTNIEESKLKNYRNRALNFILKILKPVYICECENLDDFYRNRNKVESMPEESFFPVTRLYMIQIPKVSFVEEKELQGEKELTFMDLSMTLPLRAVRKLGYKNPKPNSIDLIDRMRYHIIPMDETRWKKLRSLKPLNDYGITFIHTLNQFYLVDVNNDKDDADVNHSRIHIDDLIMSLK